mmetsp:Transcript_74021/g.147150  ORF Transcript_74021/g.147150 Transcript_74021/m.147150 type:complete len:263 (-) Transcript_74021:498-1286(-)
MPSDNSGLRAARLAQRHGSRFAHCRTGGMSAYGHDYAHIYVHVQIQDAYSRARPLRTYELAARREEGRGDTSQTGSEAETRPRLICSPTFATGLRAKLGEGTARGRCLLAAATEALARCKAILLRPVDVIVDGFVRDEQLVNSEQQRRDEGNVEALVDLELFIHEVARSLEPAEDAQQIWLCNDSPVGPLSFVMESFVRDLQGGKAERGERRVVEDLEHLLAGRRRPEVELVHGSVINACWSRLVGSGRASRIESVNGERLG